MHHTAHMVGIGCFAKNNTLQRNFRQVLENFILVKYEDICPAAERMLNDENVTRFFRSVIQLGTERPDQIDRALELFSAEAKINGFYLGLSKQSLHLIVFFQNAVRQQTKIVIRLEKFNRLRENHLH